jgi:hypothetical protein
LGRDAKALDQFSWVAMLGHNAFHIIGVPEPY